jgi:hypothetical protein
MIYCLERVFRKYNNFNNQAVYCYYLFSGINLRRFESIFACDRKYCKSIVLNNLYFEIKTKKDKYICQDLDLVTLINLEAVIFSSSFKLLTV